MVPARVSTESARLLFGQCPAHLAKAHFFPRFQEGIGEVPHLFGAGLDEMQSYSLGGPGTNARQLAERCHERIDGFR